MAAPSFQTHLIALRKVLGGRNRSGIQLPALQRRRVKDIAQIEELNSVLTVYFEEFPDGFCCWKLTRPCRPADRFGGWIVSA